MTTIVHTIHRTMPKLVEQAKEDALRRSKRGFMETLKRMPPKVQERMMKSAAETKRVNAKHGISQSRAKWKAHQPFKDAKRRSRAKVSLPKLKFLEG